MSGVFLYRLDIAHPDGSDAAGWQPEDWPEICEEHGWWSTEEDRDPPPFGWPRRRFYLDRNAADRRAKLLGEYGATVEIVTGRVVWPGAEGATP